MFSMHAIYEQMRERFEALYITCDMAFQTDCDKDELWNTYLESVPADLNSIYIKRKRFDCSSCRRFIQLIGGVLFIDPELNLHTLWEGEAAEPLLQGVMDAMDACVRSHRIVSQFLTTFRRIGTKENFGLDPEGNPVRFEHFFIDLPEDFRISGSDTVEGRQAKFRDTVQVFRRSLSELSLDSVDTVLDLVNSNTLYRGAEWKSALTSLRAHMIAWRKLSEEQQERYVWYHAGKVGIAIAKIRNHSMGVLLQDITAGMDLNQAVTRYEKIVAPTNYQRPKPIFTPEMLRQAEETITSLGYLPSLPRRFARLDDITVNNILFSNRDSARRIQGGIFEDLLAQAVKPVRQFDRVEEIPAEQFVKNVLPTARELEAYVENRHEPQFVSLIAPANPDAPSMFKWSNGFSWAYAGNIADSDIRENVKRAGGNIHGVLRFSIQWNDTDEYSRNDLDAHCKDAGGFEIFFGKKRSIHTRGTLDVDIIHPKKDTPAVENIVWENKTDMIPGDYRFFVHQFTNRGGRDGFRAEVEFDGQIFRYDYRRELQQGEKVEVAVVTLHKNGTFTIRETLPSTVTPKTIWGVNTMSFVPVSVVMYSPNYWDELTGLGNRHYFFMLKGCQNPERPNGFYNEFLKPELAQHRRVFAALGSRMKVEDTPDQLSGLGFSSTLRNELVVKVRGNTERTMKIKF